MPAFTKLCPSLSHPAPLHTLQTNRIIHGSSKKCLAISPDKKKLVMEDCTLEEGRQQWKFENYDPSKKL